MRRRPSPFPTPDEYHLEDLLPGIGLVNGDCAAVLPELPAAGLIITSPPDDNMRDIGGYNGAIDCGAVAAACAANLAPGSVLVRVEGDQIIDGDERGISFRHAPSFKGPGAVLAPTLIYC